jgi:hypothetical protein
VFWHNDADGFMVIDTFEKRIVIFQDNTLRSNVVECIEIGWGISENVLLI